MEEAGSSETLINIYQTSQPRIPENSNVNIEMAVTVMGCCIVDRILSTRDLLHFEAFVKG
jgi:hypothetical protein